MGFITIIKVRHENNMMKTYEIENNMYCFENILH